jgi:hypothetical protein
MAKAKSVRVPEKAFVSLGRKLARLRRGLTSAETKIFEFLLETVVAAEGKWPPPAWVEPHIKIRHPRHVAHVILGAAGGALVVIDRNGKITIIREKGPLPFDRIQDALGVLGIAGSGAAPH